MRQLSTRIRSRFRIALLGAALVLAGCGTSSAPRRAVAPLRPTTEAPKAISTPPPRSAPSPTPTVPQLADRLYVRTLYGSADREMTVLNAASGATERQLPNGVPAPDWSIVFAAERADGRTSIRAVEAGSGSIIRQLTLDGEYALPAAGLDGTPGGLAPNGAWLALAAVPTSDELRAFERDKHWISRFAILDTAFKQAPRIVTVDGNFWFDALSSNGESLYLIENLQGDSTGRYQVRFYNLRTKTLDPQVVVGKGESQVMQGVRQAAIASPGGDWLYSLYLNESHGPFIHALNLDNRFAICIDLPKEGRQDWEKQLFWSLAMTPGGETIYAVNGALGVVAEVDPAGLHVRRTATLARAATSFGPLSALARLLAPVAEAKRIPIGGALLSPDGKMLYTLAEKGLLALDTRDLSVRGRYLSEWALDSLALSPDGKRLYSVSAEKRTIVWLDPVTGSELGSLQGAQLPQGVLRVETRR